MPTTGCSATGRGQSDKRRKSANTQLDLSSSNKVGVKIADETGRTERQQGRMLVRQHAPVQHPGRMQSCLVVCQPAKWHYLPFPGTKEKCTRR